VERRKGGYEARGKEKVERGKQGRKKRGGSGWPSGELAVHRRTES